MNIKYDTNGFFVFTDCPFNRKDILKNTIKVNSVDCRLCKYFNYKISDKHIINCKYRDMEERTFKLSLEKAKQWYNGNSQDLKRIALEVYSEEELIRVELPNSWEEFCESYKTNGRETYIQDDCKIGHPFVQGDTINSITDKNVLPSEKAARQHLALMQLHQLRDCYRQGWKPDWEKTEYKYIIIKNANTIEKFSSILSDTFLSFQSSEIRDKFFDNFKDLIEEAGDLI